ncbi:MAG: decaprenyl-phosphate phosphoribosyltransferase [Ilumatobacteraceae bacterium]|jgi:decaprenyl-phosphate phosphoribosyltransferase|nr:decaprenyl-phosphate phosphoribosyltransferase [Ilumatobacteraceae bacterium]
MSVGAHLREARPKQWAKNVLVFAAPGAAGVLNEWSALWQTLVAFVALCMAASGTYYWNDVLDVEADRAHPRKRLRPVASGAVSMLSARIVGTILLVGGVTLAFVPDWRSGVAVVVYVVLTVSYSARLKHEAVLDLMAVAAGFVIRAIAGAEASGVEMSTWFLLCASFGALFIVTGKRYAELRDAGDTVGVTRVALTEYSLGFLRIVLSVSLAATLVAYCTWAFATKEISGSTWPFYELSIIPMLGALLRYLLVLEQGQGAAPEDVFAADRMLQGMGVAWVIVFGLGVYVG